MHRRPPVSWQEFKSKTPRKYLVPFYYANWLGEWAAYALGKWSIFEVLEYAGSFSILFAVIFYFAGAGDRLRQKHYLAWQAIRSIKSANIHAVSSPPEGFFVWALSRGAVDIAEDAAWEKLLADQSGTRSRAMRELHE